MTDRPRQNPEHELLIDLLDTAWRVHGSMATALDRPFRIMSGGDAWTGPSVATTFCDDLAFRRGALRGFADDAIAEIEHGVATTPAVLGSAA